MAEFPSKVSTRTSSPAQGAGASASSLRLDLGFVRSSIGALMLLQLERPYYSHSVLQYAHILPGQCRPPSPPGDLARGKVHSRSQRLRLAAPPPPPQNTPRLIERRTKVQKKVDQDLPLQSTERAFPAAPCTSDEAANLRQELMIFNVGATVLYITAFITCSAVVELTALKGTRPYNQRAAASFFACLVMIAYGVSAFFSFQAWRGVGSNAATSQMAGGYT
ncbi:plasmolipin [Trichechus manatus latirostris]|uniref:Plasmolipin n=1 Tax=Trichechus manatus latirostris TaxID=127582 RepID=A0A2Y9FX82_TRIMA|nr:plasmolipin [Trichechus manatus latirostris]